MRDEALSFYRMNAAVVAEAWHSIRAAGDAKQAMDYITAVSQHPDVDFLKVLRSPEVTKDHPEQKNAPRPDDMEKSALLSGQERVQADPASHRVRVVVPLLAQDKVVQSNASSAEEAATASEELAAHAEALRKTVVHLVEIVEGYRNAPIARTQGVPTGDKHHKESRRNKS